MSAVASRRIDRTRTAKQAVSKTFSIPACTGGLNAISSLAAMPPSDAVVLDNWFPQPSYVELRNGYEKWATGLPGWAETLMPYSNAAGENLFAISGTAVYDVTAAGAVGAAVVTGLSNARWESTNIATTAGQYLYAANGTDKPLFYDGVTWVKVDGGSTPAITGVTTTTLRQPTIWKNRLWFVQDATMDAWFLPTSSIGGAASVFHLGPLFRLGGQLHTITTATLTNGSVFDDYICFISTEGELALYSGTDPSDATKFFLQGIYRFGKPVGRRCTFRYGDDTIIICADGYVSLQKIISLNYLGQNATISQKILTLVNNDIQNFSDHFGWEGLVYPLGNKLILNVPISENLSQSQYVMNTISNSWCTFGRLASPWNAATFAVLGNSLYFGGNTYVALADVNTLQADDGNNIQGTLKTAFSIFGSPLQKLVKQVRPILQSTGEIFPALSINTDYGDALPTSVTPGFLPGTQATWNVASWNVDYWAAGFTLQRNWLTPSGIEAGFAVALYIVVATNSTQVRYLANDYLWEQGSIY